jgi:hypothetical protein
MKYSLFLLFIFFGTYYVCAYLHSNHWNIINNLLKKDKYRKPIENILYNHHHYWSRKYTKNFIKKYNFIINNHQLKNLQCCASIGLLKSIRNYNGRGNFYVYSSIYMNGELFKGITQVYPIKLLPHHLRVNKKWKQSNPETFLKNMKATKYIGNDEYILEYCKINNSYNLPNEIRKIITDLPSQDIRLFYSRYNVHDLSVKRTVKYLSYLFACSEKTINKRLSNIHNDLSFLLTI